MLTAARLGALADRIGSRQIFIIGFILMPVTFLWLIPSREVWMLYLFAVVFGFAQGGMGASESLLVADIFGLRSHGLIYGVTACGFTFGSAVGPWATGYLFDIFGSYRPALAACAAIGVIGLLLTLMIRPIRDSVVSRK